MNNAAAKRSDEIRPSPLVRLSRITKKFGVVMAVAGVDLEVYGGDFLAIFGPNGAGKTTLLRIVATLAHPTSGELVFAGDGTLPNRGRVGYVSHQSLVYNELTGLENLQFYARLHGLQNPDERASTMLSQMGLDEAGGLLVRGYSRGMKQRLTLGRALLHEPQQLLLDEPYTGLDQHGSRLLTGVLSELRAQGRTVMLITHNLAEGLELSTRIVIQHRGRLRFQGKREELDLRTLEQLYFQIVEK